MDGTPSRETLGSRLGFILISAGCAVGLGNVWKFPYMVGQNGGGLFVLFYLVFLIALGVPILCMEYSIGRGSRSSPLRMFSNLREGRIWRFFGYMSTAGCILLMMFYCVVSGWMLYYFILTAAGGMEGLGSSEISGIFSNLVSDPLTLAACTLVIIAAGFIMCSLGLRNCLEKVTKVLMTATFVIMVVLALFSLTMEGAGAGIEYYLMPDIDRTMEKGIVNVVIAAMSQAFFTLSLGIGSMAVFGSYLNRERSLPGEAAFVAALDTAVAILAGLIIFPACFTYGVDVGSGPSLIFETMPNVFNSLPGGRIWGSMFFLFLCFASFSTCLALFEAQTASFKERLCISRRKACAIVGPLMFALTIPCILGFSVWSGFHPFGGMSNIMDLEDFLVSNLMLPVGSIAIVVFCTTRYGWGWKGFTDEANAGDGWKVKPWMRGYLKYVLPSVVAIVLLSGLDTII